MTEQAGKSARRRLSLITVDQAIAGASNVLVSLLAARVLGVEAFGLFGIVFLAYVMAQGVSRALVGDPLLVHPEEARTRTGEVIGTGAVLGVGLGLVALAAGLAVTAVEPRLGEALLVLAVCLPTLVLQDLGRYLGFATQRPATALVLDSVWLALVVVAIAALLVADGRTLAWFVLAWAGSGAVTGLLILAQHRGVRVRASLAWLRHTWPFSWRYLISYSSTQGAALAASSVIGGLAGSRALGGVQGTILLARPFGTFQVAAVAAGVAEVSNQRMADQQVRRHARRTSTFVFAVALVNGAIMVLLPDRFGRLVLGDSWTAAKPLLLATAAQLLALGVITGARAGLLGLRAVRRTVVIDVVSTVLVLLATVLGALVAGVRGALWGVALVQGVLAVVWWTVLLRHTAAGDCRGATDLSRPVGSARDAGPQAAPATPSPSLVSPAAAAVDDAVVFRAPVPFRPWQADGGRRSRSRPEPTRLRRRR